MLSCEHTFVGQEPKACRTKKGSRRQTQLMLTCLQKNHRTPARNHSAHGFERPESRTVRTTHPASRPATRSTRPTTHPVAPRRACAIRPTARIATCIALSTLLALSTLGLLGCKDSDSLTEHIEDPLAGILDESAEPIYREAPDAPTDTTRTSTYETDNDNLVNQENVLPEYDEDEQDPAEADQRIHDEDTPDDADASRGTRPSDQNGTSSEGGGAGGNDDEQSNEPEPAGTGGTVDFNNGGTIDDLPEGTSTVAAAGQYAVIVQMLAGQGALVAADEQFIADAQAKGAFPDEGVESLATTWRGDGSYEGTFDIEATIAASPDCVVVGSNTSSIGEEERSRLSAAGITVVIGPALGETDTADADIVSAVKLVGELLKDASAQYDVAAMTNAYLQQHDEAVSNCVSANGGYSTKMIGGTALSYIYQKSEGTSTGGTDTTNLSNVRYTTAFIDSWSTAESTTTAMRRFNNASLYLDGETMDASDGIGLSATGVSGNFMLMDYYLQTAGVVNNSYDTAKPVSSGNGESLPYLIIPGSGEDLVTYEVAVRNVPSALWYPIVGYGISDAWTCVGDASFPAVLARDSDIAENVCASASKANGLYNVGVPYEVHAVPQGIAGSWADGTVESFLLAPWAYCMFQQDASLNTCTTYAQNFYSTFYRCDALDAIADYQTTMTAPCPTS